MNISKAIELGKQHLWSEACAYIDPSDTSQWFIMLTDKDYKTFMLVDDDEIPFTSTSLEHFIPLLKSVGLKSFSVVFC